MNDIEVSSIDLVEGGNVFKQGHYLTLGYVPRDEKGETVDLSGKTLNVSLWGRKGVVFEAAATYSDGVIRFTFDELVAAGDYTVEFTATSSTDAKYRKKFPTNQHSGRIAIKQSADDLGVVGIQVYTVAQLKAEQKAIQTQYESTVDAKVQASDAKSATALTKSTTAEATANDVKSQFEQVVISGDSSVEAAAARVAPDQTFVSLKARLDAKEQATAEQLVEAGGQLSDVKVNMNREVVAKKTRKPLMTFVDDDGRFEVFEKWQSIVVEKQIPLTVGLITDWVGDEFFLTWDDIRALKALGVRFASHTHNHRLLGDQTEAFIRTDYEDSIRTMRENGVSEDSNIMVYPGGSQNELSRQLTREYFRAGVSTSEGVNYPPLNTFSLKRSSLADVGYNTLEYYKSVIDEAVANNGWIIWKSHSQYPAFDATQIANIKELIDYARLKGVDIVGMNEGLDYFGNIIDIGDYVASGTGAEYTIIDSDGVMHSKANAIQFRAGVDASVAFGTPPSYFPKNTKNVTLINTNFSQFPEGKQGNLETFRAASDSFTFQLYYIYNSNNIYKRIWNTTNNTWNGFEKITIPPADLLPINSAVDAFTTLSEPSAFEGGKITYTRISSANTSLSSFPGGIAGVLMTNRLYTNGPNYCFQQYNDYSGRVWTRGYVNTAWTEWVRIDIQQGFGKATIPETVLTANATVDVLVPVTGAKASDLVYASPNGGLIAGVQWSAYCSSANNITVRFTNMTAASVTMIARNWVFGYKTV